MTFQGEPDVESLEFETDRIRASLISEDDAAEAFELLTHPELEFLDPSQVPGSAAAFAGFAREIRARSSNDELYRIYQWAVRLKDGGSLVGLLTGQLTLEPELQADGPPLQHRTVETTAYIHPAHQNVGYGSEAGDRMRELVKTAFDLNRQSALIRWDNERAQVGAAKRGLVKLEGMTAQGYETWQTVL